MVIMNRIRRPHGGWTMRAFGTALIALAAGAGLPAGAAGAAQDYGTGVISLYVAPGAGHAATGTAAHPFATIAQAEQAAHLR
jgi:hypothetical protein